jgi:aspartyl-tRNA synthetase
MHIYRSHNCNELNKNLIGQKVKLSGWIHSKRDHGDLIFFDLRDHYGLTQCVADTAKMPEIDEESIKKINKATFDNNQSNISYLAKISLESVITVIGEVVERSKETINNEIATGAIELRIEKIQIESLANQIPFQINKEDENYPEDLRLKYRFLDLRTTKTHNNIILRSRVINEIRKLMTEQKFLEIQTPILTASSPEGARDYVVPSRLHHGKFYALPQAPQQFKQLLMLSGFDRYFQIAPCFRDEDLRSDRSPEFYQLDMEMSFVTQEDIFSILEPLLKNIFNKFGVKKVVDEDFIKITYQESMLKYGTDKPDLRNPIQICQADDIFIDSDFSIFTKALSSGATIRAIPAPGTANNPRSFFDKMIKFATDNGAKGLAYIIFDENAEAKGPIAKFVKKDKLEELKRRANLKENDAVFFSCGNLGDAQKVAAIVRDKLGQDLHLIDESIYKFCWIIDFPMYEIDQETNKINFSHNPFSMPQGGLEILEKEDPLKIKAYQYDIVCNGVELSSGAIRNHKPEIMYKAFSIAGYSEEQVNNEFGAMINAFKYGAPPHGGIAPGIDRIIMLLANEPNIREVIPFPMNGKAQDLMMEAPKTITAKHLKELNIKISESSKLKVNGI